MMRKFVLLICFGLVLFAGVVEAAEPNLPSKKDRCPVCGMFVAPYPEWTSTIQFKDGTQLFFDGAKDLYRYYLSLPSKNDSRTREEIAAIYLTDYYSTKLMPVEELYLVIGSDVFGPMGHEFVPIAGEDAARTFATDHAGQKILRFEQLSPQLIPVD